MPYNSGKNFSIDSEVDFFLTEAMNAAKQVADNAQLTTNNPVIELKPGVITGWNDYFEMYSQPSLANVPEVLLWKQYSFSLNDYQSRCSLSCEDWLCRWIYPYLCRVFLMKNGLPIYASNDYQGDVSIDNVKPVATNVSSAFVWVRVRCLILILVRLSTSQPFKKPGIDNSNQEIRCITGYQPRKYYTYDYTQTRNDEFAKINACPHFPYS